MKLIDTSVLIDSLRRGNYEEGSISVITLIEVLRGISPEKRNRVKQLLEKSFNVLSIDNKVIMRYCELYGSLKREGRLIPDTDLLIAATAIENGLVLATKDKDFEQLRKLGLKLELRSG